MRASVVAACLLLTALAVAAPTASAASVAPASDASACAVVVGAGGSGVCVESTDCITVDVAGHPFAVVGCQ